MPFILLSFIFFYFLQSGPFNDLRPKKPQKSPPLSTRVRGCGQRVAGGETSSLSLSSARPDHYDNVFYHTYEPANEKEISRIPSSENNEPTLADSARKTGGPRRAQRQA
jgi:hypothetical protein